VQPMPREGLQPSQCLSFEYKGGRPLKYSEGIVNRLAFYLMCKESPIANACRLCGVDRSTVWRWMKRYSYARQVLENAIIQSKRTRAEAKKRFCNADFPKPTHTRKVRQPPRKYRPEMANQVGSSIQETARILGVHPSTVFRWTRKHREFFAAQALAQRKAALERLRAMADAIEREFAPHIKRLEALGYGAEDT